MRNHRPLQEEALQKEELANGTAKGATATVVDEQPQAGVASGTDDPVIPLVEYERVKAERDQFFDRLARLQAEFDNARKREARERGEFRDFAVASALEQFLPVLDNFQLALNSQGSAEQLRSGVELIVKQMEDALKSIGVQPVDTVGTQFDPRFHEALGTVDTAEAPDQQVMEEIRRGYRIKDRLLRPALVRVANNTMQQEA